ncbi:MAG TPA: hypothetical protein VMF57_11035 [Solirubrobacteraceae bacterium]|nr:hypothetical protein [Solirubrobacteraceae bacterium]
MHSGPLAFLRMYLFYAKPWQQLVICAGVILAGAALVVFAGQVGGILVILFGVVAGGPVARRLIR